MKIKGEEENLVATTVSTLILLPSTYLIFPIQTFMRNPLVAQQQFLQYDPHG